MPEKMRWIDKVLGVFIEEIERPPTDKEELELQRKLMTLAQYRLNGLDHRRVGLLVADLYRLMYSTRRRIIEDVAKVAVGTFKKEGS